MYFNDDAIIVTDIINDKTSVDEKTLKQGYQTGFEFTRCQLTN